LIAPAPKDIVAARHKAGLTQTEAAQLVSTNLRSWQRWEAGERKMRPAFWELFLMKAANLSSSKARA
jgi:putative transcriptional regulator